MEKQERKVRWVRCVVPHDVHASAKYIAKRLGQSTHFTYTMILTRALWALDPEQVAQEMAAEMHIELLPLEAE